GDEPKHERPHDLRNILPADILQFSNSLPLSPLIRPSVDTVKERLRNLHWYLPSAEKAAELRDVYYTYAAWMYNPISMSEFNATIYSILFKAKIMLSQRLSVMFMVLAIGSLMDVRLTSYTLFQNNIFDEPTLGAVQALYLMSFYLFLSDKHGMSGGSRWTIMGMAVKLAQSVNRDTGRWKLDFAETQRRRECLTFGRPPAFTTAHVDCKMPFQGEPPVEDAFNAWKHRFSSECMAPVHDQVFGAKTPTYATILQLDRKLRAYPVPQALQIAGNESVSPCLVRCLRLLTVLADLLYMHRGFFARALNDHPKDPLGTLMRNLHSQLQEPMERMWFLWTHMFSCAIILGSIVTRCPSLSLAPSALVQLDSACALFSKAARGFKAEKVLEVMIKLREKAHASLQAFKDGRGSPLVRTVTLSDADVTMEDDELAALGGRTRLVGKGSAPTRPSTPVIMQESPTSHHPGIDEHVHPTVLDYLRTFGPSQASQPPQPITVPITAPPSRASSMLFTPPPLSDPGAPPISSSVSSAPQTPRTVGLVDNSLCSPIQLDSQMPEEQLVRNTTPEASTMQNSWQDFIAQFGLY
ncbi:hypothetical protein BJV77DRAFT_1015520, partial [Russula vinacea]